MIAGCPLVRVLITSLAALETPQIDFTAKLETIRAKDGLLWLSVAAASKAQSVGVGAVGVCQMGKAESGTLEAACQLGSDFKSINATMIKRLVERNILRWDSNQGETLPNSSLRDEFKNIPLEMLLAQCSSV